MSTTEFDVTEKAKWDPVLTEQVIRVARPAVKAWFRSEVRGLDRIPPGSGLMRRLGLVRASRPNAADALHSGGVVLVFPGGDHEVYRPTWHQHVIDFKGRTGYVRTAVEAVVPIVPMVSIGGRKASSTSPAASGWLVGSEPNAGYAPISCRSHWDFPSGSLRFRSTCRCPARSSRRFSNRSTSLRSSARNPTSPLSTRMCAR